MQINLFYNEFTGEYLFNEKSEFTATGVSHDNIRKDLEELLNVMLYKFHHRRHMTVKCRLPEKDFEFARKYISKFESKFNVESD